jgi:hypothetical protein
MSHVFDVRWPNAKPPQSSADVFEFLLECGKTARRLRWSLHSSTEAEGMHGTYIVSISPHAVVIEMRGQAPTRPAASVERRAQIQPEM